MTEVRKFSVGALTRVEGEGALEIHLRGSQVERVELRIYEPPRFFETLLRGRDLREVPDIVARICGICPVAYQMSACQALEKALGMTLPPEISQLRRLLYCGEWIESHSLHMIMLHAPDFLGFENSLEMAREHPDLFESGLRIRKLGNDLLTILGGRAIHPINIAVGGFYRTPSADRLRGLLPEIAWAKGKLPELLRQMADWKFPVFEQDYQFVSLYEPHEYPLNTGRVAASDGLLIPIEDYEKHFREIHQPHSTALQSLRVPNLTTYLVGPLARLHLCRSQLTPAAADLANELLGPGPLKNNALSLLVRGIEVLFAIETAETLIRNYRDHGFPCRVEIPRRGGSGCHATEAPRGLLYHRYEVDEQGRISAATIIPPTSQNQAQIESDLRALVPTLLSASDAEATRACENLIRHYDPCISCATHFLRLHWRQDGAMRRLGEAD